MERRIRELEAKRQSLELRLETIKQSGQAVSGEQLREKKVLLRSEADVKVRLRNLKRNLAKFLKTYPTLLNKESQSTSEKEKIQVDDKDAEFDPTEFQAEAWPTQFYRSFPLPHSQLTPGVKKLFPVGNPVSQCISARDMKLLKMSGQFENADNDENERICQYRIGFFNQFGSGEEKTFEVSPNKLKGMNQDMHCYSALESFEPVDKSTPLLRGTVKTIAKLVERSKDSVLQILKEQQRAVERCGGRVALQGGQLAGVAGSQVGLVCVSLGDRGKLCTFFSSPAGCRHGPACHYLHLLPPAAAEKRTLVSGTDLCFGRDLCNSPESVDSWATAQETLYSNVSADSPVSLQCSACESRQDIGQGSPRAAAALESNTRQETYHSVSGTGKFKYFDNIKNQRSVSVIVLIRSRYAHYI